MRTVGLLVVAGLGLLVAGAGWVRLARWRRFAGGRRLVNAVVVGARDRTLRLRLLLGGSEPVLSVDVGPAVAASWALRLDLGPPPVDEPEYDDGSHWDRVAVSYQPGVEPEVILADGLADARSAVVAAIVLGLLIAGFALLGLAPAVLLGALGSVTAVVAAGFAATGVQAVRVRHSAKEAAQHTIVALILSVAALGMFAATVGRL
jgi:hypothetical protein